MTPNFSALPEGNAETTHGNRRYAMVCWHLSSNLRYIFIFKFLTWALKSVSVASEVSDLGDEQEESMEALTRDLERLAISPDSTLYQPSSSQEETQSTTDDSISQATCAQFPRPPDNTDEGKVAALQ